MLIFDRTKCSSVLDYENFKSQHPHLHHLSELIHEKEYLPAVDYVQSLEECDLTYVNHNGFLTNQIVLDMLNDQGILDAAAWHYAKVLLRTLAVRGADINATHTLHYLDDCDTNLVEMVIYCIPQDLSFALELIRTYGADIHRNDMDNQNAYFLVFNSIERAQFLVEHFPELDINQEDIHGNTPLANVILEAHKAASPEDGLPDTYVNVIHYLEEHGAKAPSTLYL